MRKLLVLTIFAALLSAPQPAFCYDQDDWFTQQKIERQRQETEERLRKIERQQRKAEQQRQWDRIRNNLK